jgi:hypothetical protein
VSSSCSAPGSIIVPDSESIQLEHCAGRCSRARSVPKRCRAKAVAQSDDK